MITLKDRNETIAKLEAGMDLLEASTVEMLCEMLQELIRQVTSNPYGELELINKFKFIESARKEIARKDPTHPDSVSPITPFFPAEFYKNPDKMWSQIIYQG